MPKDDEGAASGPVRLSVTLSAEAAEAIRIISDRHGITITEALRRAISSHKYLDDAHRRGAKILIEEKPGGAIRELVFVL